MSSPYNFEASDDGLDYHFTTRFGLHYTITFTAVDLFGIKALSISIDYKDDLISEQVFPLDYNVKQTIIKIVSSLLEDDQNAVIYVCDNTDGRENQRHFAFLRWYSDSVAQYPYVNLYERVFESGYGYKINAALLYNVNNPFAKTIIEGFDDLLDLY